MNTDHHGWVDDPAGQIFPPFTDDIRRRGMAWNDKEDHDCWVAYKNRASIHRIAQRHSRTVEGIEARLFSADGKCKAEEGFLRHKKSLSPQPKIVSSFPPIIRSGACPHCHNLQGDVIIFERTPSTMNRDEAYRFAARIVAMIQPRPKFSDDLPTTFLNYYFQERQGLRDIETD